MTIGWNLNYILRSKSKISLQGTKRRGKIEYTKQSGFVIWMLEAEWTPPVAISMVSPGLCRTKPFSLYEQLALFIFPLKKHEHKHAKLT